MIKLLILGHNGMLGNAVFKFFSQYPKKYEIFTMNERWGNKDFIDKISSIKTDYIINCIGAIPQKYSGDINKYKELNIDLPIFLETLGKKIIHPSTDCEFSGDLPLNKKYLKDNKRDASDDYGKSKAFISKKIEDDFVNTKMIRASVIGHETGENKTSLLEWTLSQHDKPIKGYTNHYWNGITTLEWCKLCQDLILNWDNKPKLNQYGTENIINKYDLVKMILSIYGKNTIIEPYSTGKIINKCLQSDMVLPKIDEQIRELKNYYGN